MAVTEQASACTRDGCGRPWPDHTFDMARQCVEATDPFAGPAESVEEVIRNLFMATTSARRFALEHAQEWGEASELGSELAKRSQSYADGVRMALSIVTGLPSEVLREVVL